MISKCVICGKKFIKIINNKKTCGSECSKELKRKNSYKWKVERYERIPERIIKWKKKYPERIKKLHPKWYGQCNHPERKRGYNRKWKLKKRNEKILFTALEFAQNIHKLKLVA